MKKRVVMESFMKIRGSSRFGVASNEFGFYLFISRGLGDIRIKKKNSYL